MKKVRIAFLLPLSSEWMGGVNYYKNLLNIIIAEEQFEIIGIVADDIDKNLLNGFPKSLEIVSCRFLNRSGWLNVLRRGILKLFKHDVLLDYILHKERIDVVSHQFEPLNFHGIKQVAWIPDFQHKHLSEIFSKEDIISRDKKYIKLAELANLVVLSSNDAKRDFEMFFGKYKEKARVMPFVVPNPLFNAMEKEKLQKYQLPRKYFYIPNQFWVHKNHRVVIEALSLLKKEGIEAAVVCTGATEDYRDKKHYAMLSMLVEKNNLKGNFIVLGKVPYGIVCTLMQQSIALINPSLFEGWSTMVEEAKSMGKRIILSDLNVHKEQNPRGGIFFKKESAVDLAEKMKSIWCSTDEMFIQSLHDTAANDLNTRKQELLFRYKQMIHELMEKNNGHI